MKKGIYLLAIILVFSISFCVLNGQQTNKKWYPGHYLYVGDHSYDKPMPEKHRDMIKDNPYFRGYHGRYHWSVIETSKDVYDFSNIEKDIETARKDGKKLIVHITDRVFYNSTTNPPVPNYIINDPIYEGGFYRPTAKPHKMPKLWVPAYAERMGELIKALGKRFDADTVLSYVILDETALIEAKDQPGFSSAKLRDASKTIYSAAAVGLINTIFSQMGNWSGGMTRADADNLMEHLVSLGHGLGGPDALEAREPYDGVKCLGALDNFFGPYYVKYKNIIPITSSSQSPSYKANDPLTVLNYAINKLNSHFMSWAPQLKSASSTNLFGSEEVIAMVTQQKGKINTTPPSTIVSTNNVKSSSLRVYSVNKTLRMEGLTPGNKIEIFTVTGNLLVSYTADTDYFETELSQGLYLVRADNESRKTIVF